MVFHQKLHAGLVDNAFEIIHLVVIGDDGVGQLEIALQQCLDGAFEVVAGFGGHGEDFAFQFREGEIEVLDDVGRVIHMLDLSWKAVWGSLVFPLRRGVCLPRR